MNARRDQERVLAEVEVLRTVKLLSAISQEGETLSQRELSKQLGIALGLVNSYLQRLIRKGYIKVTTLPRNRLNYILTPRGIAEKSRLTYEYAYFSYRLYRSTRQQCRDLMISLAKKGQNKIILYGTGDVAEIAYLSLQEAELTLVAVVAKRGRGQQFFGFPVQSFRDLARLKYDKIIVASSSPPEEVETELIQAGIEEGRVCWLKGKGWPT